MCTGIRSRALTQALAAALLLLPTGSSQAQRLKLVSLTVPADARPGSWISYQVNVAFKNRPPKRITQRLAVVSREGSGDESGAWVELRTVESGKTRVERGFFAPPEHGAGRVETGAAASRKLTLARYQRLMPDGRLLEYRVGEEGAPMADDDISAMDLIEFAGSTTSEPLAPDTLRIGRNVLACEVWRTRRFGMKDWQGDDTTYVNRAVMTRTDWRNSGVPVTGYARSVIEVGAERVPVPPPALADTAAAAGAHAAADSARAAGASAAGSRGTPGGVAPSDSAGAAAAVVPAPVPGAQGFFFRAEIILLGLGNDAVPEITQAPEPAPEDAVPRPRNIIR